MKKQTIVALVVVGIVTILGAAFMVAPEEKSNAIKESFRRITGNLPQKCLDDVRVGLNDPDSARIVSFKQIVGKNDYLLNYKAKNPTGGYFYGEIEYNNLGKQHGH